MECPDQGDENYGAYLDKCIEVEKNMIFNIGEFKRDNPGFDLDCPVWSFDIPLEERVFEYKIERNEDDIKRIEPTVIRAREYLNELNRTI